MRVLPLSMIIVAFSMAGCMDDPPVDKVGTAAALARTIAAEQDHVTVPELSDWIIKDQRDYELVDIRDKADFDEGRIEGARHIPLAALMSDAALAAMPAGRKVVVYSNGTAHAAQAALLLRLVDRDAYALLGGFNYWQAYLKDAQSAGVAEMDPVKRARYQAVSCFFEGEYVAAAGLTAKGAAAHAQPQQAVAEGGSDPLGLGLGLGSEEVREMGLDAGSAKPQTESEDPLGLGLGLGLGGEAAKELQKDKPTESKGSVRKLLIKAEC